MTPSNPYSSLRRVVVTGLGARTPLGLSMQETWENAIAGRSGVGPITLFDTKDCPVQFAGEVTNYDPTAPIGPFKPSPNTEITHISSKKDLKKMDRFIHLGLGAGLEAYGDSGLDSCRDQFDPTRFGVNIGVGMGGLPEIAKVHDDLNAKGYKRITPFFIPEVIPNLAAGHLSILLNCQGPNVCNVTACTSSAHAIGESFHMIKRGDADIMMAGGAECVVTPLAVGGFASMRALSTRNDAPEKASRPFDRDRDGFVMGEGSAVLILEELEFAKKRGAKIYGEIKGYGLSSDAHHMTLPAPEARGGFRAMEMAMMQAERDFGISKTEIGYVNAHGTSTPAGDAEEAYAVRQLFPDGPKHLHVSSTKSMTGHLLGAAGALEAALCVLAVENNIIPPTINLDNLDPKCAELGFDYTANKAVEKKFDYALTNSFGFGGTNGSIVLGSVGKL